MSSMIVMEDNVPVLLTKDMGILHEFLFEYMVDYFETEVLTNKHIIKTIGTGLDTFDSLLKIYDMAEDVAENKFILSATDIFGHITQDDLVDYKSESEDEYTDVDSDTDQDIEGSDYFKKMQRELSEIIDDEEES